MRTTSDTAHLSEKGGGRVVHDVVVVGAGFAGLTAARDLSRRGYDVIVVEGRDRVGGRSRTGTIAGVPIDLGGTFVGPTQTEVLKLAAELGCDTVPTYHAGKSIISWRGRTRTYTGTIPKLPVVELLDLARVQLLIAGLTKFVPLSEPWTSRIGKRLDAQTLGSWLRSVFASKSTRDLMSIIAKTTWGAEPDSVSLLHALRYIKAAGGFDALLNVEGGAQQDRFPAGIQQIAIKIADELGDRVRLSSPVRRIDHDITGVVVHTDDDSVRARAVIVSIAPEHRQQLSFEPPLPVEYGAVARHWPQGYLGKVYAAYDKPFWRSAGYSGAALSDGGPVFITFDCSPGDDGPGILLGFTDGHAFDGLPAEERRARAIDNFVELFGDEARDPIDYVDQRWQAEEFAPGGPTAAVPPGAWTRYGQWLRKPVDGVFWAGTETADEWTGFFDGAVRSGHRAAAEVTDHLASPSSKPASVLRT